MNAWWHESPGRSASHLELDAERPLRHSHAERGNDHRRHCHEHGFTITGGIVLGGSSRGGGWVPGGSCSGTGSGSVGGMTGLSMFGSGVSAGIGILIVEISECQSAVAHGVTRA